MNDKEIKKYLEISNISLIMPLVLIIILNVVLRFLNNVILFFIGWLLLIFCILYFLKSLNKKVKIINFNQKNNRKKILNELKKESNNNYLQYGCVLLQDKLLIINSLQVIAYKDILWVYYYSLMNNNKQPVQIMAALNSGKTYQIAEVKNKIDNFLIGDEIIEEIKNKNNNILVGYTKEKKDKYKKMLR